MKKLFFFFILTVVILGARAATNVVTSIADTGAGTLRQMLAAGSPGDTVTFTNSLSGQVLLLTNGQIVLSYSVTIDASGLPAGIRLDGIQASRIFSINGGVTAVLNSLTLTNGSSGTGGAINNAGNLTLNRCSLVGNVSSGGGGAIASIVTNASLTLANCTLTKNTANFAGAIWNHGGSVMNLLHCTIVGNTGTGGTGGLVLEDGPATLQNTIVATNSGTVDADIGGCGGSLILVGNNFIGQFAGCYPLLTGTPNTNGQFVGSSVAPINPLLAPLGNYGGPTPTLPPLLGSLVIDSGSDVVAAGLSVDQRGFARLVVAHVDIGAVEMTASEKINGPIPAIRWTVGNSNWDAASLTWADVLANVPVNYTPGRNVLFDDLASGASPILVTNTLAITNGNITFNNTAMDYTLAGPGVISNNVPITKLGTGIITITTTNNFYGGTFFLGAGKLALPLGAALGAAASGALIVMSNNTAIALGSSGNTTPAVPLRIAAGATVTNTANALGTGFSGDVTSADSASVINDNSSITYGGNFQGFTGTLMVNSGTTRFSKGAAGATDLGSTNASFIVNATLLPRNNGCTVHLGSLSGSGTLGGVQTLVAGTTTTTFSIGANNISSTFAGTFAQSVLPSIAATTNFPTAIVKVGTGTLTLSGTSTNTGPTTVSSGTLTLVTGGALASSTMTVANGATNGVSIVTTGGSCSVGNLTYTAGSTTVQFDFGANTPSASVAPLQVQNNVGLTGSALSVVVNGNSFPVGTYPLISYGGTLSGPAPTTVLGLHAGHFQLLNDTANKRISLQVVTPFNPVVVNTNDAGAGSLRQAVADTRAGDIISFTNTLFGQTILLTSGQIILSNSVTIDGSAILGGMKISGNNASRIFFVTNASVVLNALQLMNGNIVGDKGGGIVNSTNSSVTINNCLLSGNYAYGNNLIGTAGDNAFGGAIFNAGTMTLNLSTLAGNSAIGSPNLGGYNASHSFGGAIFNAGRLTLNQDTFAGNSAVGGNAAATFFGTAGSGGSGYGGAIYNDVNAVLVINQNTFSGDSATGGSGAESPPPGPSNGIYGGNGGRGSGGAIFNNGSTNIINQSTFAGNSVAGGNGGQGQRTPVGLGGVGGSGGSGFGAAICSAITLTLNQSTLSANVASGGTGGKAGQTLQVYTGTFGSAGAGYGGGIYNDGGQLNMTNSIIAGNIPDDSPPGFNCLTNTNPMLAALNINGGFTQTMLPLPGSPAIDNGNDAAAASSGFFSDQRSQPLPVLLHADIGAVEVQAASAPSVVNLDFSYPAAANITLSATIAPNGLPTTYYLAYGSSANYDQMILLGNLSGGLANVSATLSNLLAGSLYHFSMVASNSLGVTYGNDYVTGLSNDNFANRLPLIGSVSGNNLGATLEASESDPGSGAVSINNTVWWTWTAPTNGLAAINTAGSSFDTILDVYTGNTLAGLTLVASNLATVLNTESKPSPYINYPPYTNAANAGLTNRIGFVTTAGTTYHVRVSGLTSGTIQIAPSPVALRVLSVTKLTTNAEGSIVFNATVQAGNSGTTTSQPLNLSILARAGYSVVANSSYAQPVTQPDQVLTNYYFTLPPGMTTNLFITNAVCPGTNSDFYGFVGYGYGILGTLQEQFGGYSFFKDGETLFYGSWPAVGGYTGPGAGVARINPSVGGSTFVSVMASAIIGPTQVFENSTNAYYASVTLTGPQTIFYTNSTWMASAFTMTTNAIFQTGNVTTNTPVKLVSYFNFGGYDYSNQLSVLVLNRPTNSFTGFGVVSNRFFSMTLNALPNTKFAVETTTNLVLPITWIPLATNLTDANGLWKFTDSSYTNRGQHFYRGRKIP